MYGRVSGYIRMFSFTLHDLLVSLLG